MTQRHYRPPTRRRMQLEAWTVLLLFLAVSWCVISGVAMGLRLASALVRAALG